MLRILRWNSEIQSQDHTCDFQEQWNLEWATYGENLSHAYATGLKKGSTLGVEKRKEAYNLRLAGNSYNEIADILNISRNYVGVLIHKYKNNK